MQRLLLPAISLHLIHRLPELLILFLFDFLRLGRLVDGKLPENTEVEIVHEGRMEVLREYAEHDV